MEEAARIALTSTAEFLAGDDRLERVQFVLFGADAFQVFSSVMEKDRAA